MLSILFYLNRFPGYGGIETVTQVLANFMLSTEEYNVTILSVEQQDEKSLLKKLDKRVGFYKIKNKTRILDPINLKLLDEIVIKSKIDIIIFQDNYMPIESLLYHLKGRVKIIIAEHNTPDCFIKTFDYWKANNYLSTFKNILSPIIRIKISYDIYKRHNKLYSLSDKYVLETKKYIPIFKNVTRSQEIGKLTYINNPLTTEINLQPLANKEKLCLFVGRLSFQKGVDKLINIWKIVESQNNEWQLLIVGDGELLSYVEEQIKFYSLKNVKIYGFSSNLDHLYKRASILCMTSIFEGWPLVLFEAMNFGVVPILFNSFESASEIIDSGLNGVLIDPFDIEKYSIELLNLISNSNTLYDFSTSAIEKTKRFEINVIVNKWQELFNKL